jgi:tartronate-semialdehyde synthase
VAVVEGLGCKAIRVHTPDEIIPAFEKARELMAQYSVPVVVEIILERVTNIAMGTEINAINEFNDILDVA